MTTADDTKVSWFVPLLRTFQQEKQILPSFTETKQACSNLRHTTALVLVLWCTCLALWPSAASAKAIPVELRTMEQGWQLLRGGEPYFIRGAGGNASLEQLAAAGANSVRTWGPMTSTRVSTRRTPSACR